MLLALKAFDQANTVSTRSGRTSLFLRLRRRSADVAPKSVPVEFTWANRRPGTMGFARWTATVGQRLDELGLDAASHDIENLVAVARRYGVAPVAADVLADPSQPDVARLRAFSHVAAALASAPTTIPR
jgi:hypothetical protein